MEIIPEDVVEKTWREVAAFSPTGGKKEMMKVNNNQPKTLAFLTELTEKWDQQVRELAIYIKEVSPEARSLWTFLCNLVIPKGPLDFLTS